MTKLRGNYTPEQLELIRSACLTVASITGDICDDLVVVGGLTPALLIDINKKTGETHPGTMDLDLGIDMGIFDDKRYLELTKRLRSHNFAPDKNESGNEIFQRWVYTPNTRVKIDFLIQPTEEGQKAGSIKHIEKDFGAYVIPGLELAAKNRRAVTLEGRSLADEQLKRTVWVAEAGAFIVLKTLAFKNRGEHKDAFDLYYVIKNYSASTEEIVKQFEDIKGSEYVTNALTIIEEEFESSEHAGPKRVEKFYGGIDDDMRQDASALALELVSEVRKIL